MFSVALKEANNLPVCHHCHGAGSNSTLPDVPNLASQNAAHLLEQMNKFAQGQRKSAFMEGLTKALVPGERIDPKMASFTRNHKDADIQSPTAYLSVLQP